jgi:hypothetical protein
MLRPRWVGSLLNEIARACARQMLAAALQAEVTACVEAHRSDVDQDGRRLVVRNGQRSAQSSGVSGHPKRASSGQVLMIGRGDVGRRASRCGGCGGRQRC